MADPRSLLDAQTKAKSIVAKARAQAHALLSLARLKRKELLAKARASKPLVRRGVGAIKPAGEPKEPKPKASNDLPAKIGAAYVKLTHGAYNVAVPLYKLRFVLNTEAPAMLNKALLELMGRPNVVLFREDDPEARSPELKWGALNLNGELKHYIKFTRATASAKPDPKRKPKTTELYGAPFPKKATITPHLLMIRAAGMVGAEKKPIRLARLRYGLVAAREDVDRALLRLVKHGHIELRAQSNPTESDQAAAIIIRGKPQHVVYVL